MITEKELTIKLVGRDFYLKLHFVMSNNINFDWTDAGGPDFQACTSDNKNILPDDQLAFGTVPIEVPANDPYLSKYNIGCLDFVRSQPIYRNDCKFGAAEFVRTRKICWYERYIVHR